MTTTQTPGNTTIQFTRIAGEVANALVVATFATRDQLDAVAAALPKTVRSQVHTHWLRGDDGAIWHRLSVGAQLRANRANGGANEAGVRRLRRVLAELRGAGHELLPYADADAADLAAYTA